MRGFSYRALTWKALVLSLRREVVHVVTIVV